MITEDKGTQFEIFESTGDFVQDFNELSTILGISASIRERPKIPSGLLTPEPPKTPPSGGKRKETRSKSIAQEKTDEIPLIINDDLPLTYVISSNDDEYFRPQLFYESEEENNKKEIKKLYLRGWLAEQRVLDILSKIIPSLERLTVLDMWNAGLKDETLHTLSECLSACASLKTLNLNGNHLTKKQRFDQFLAQDKALKLQNLSLRSCGLNADGALLLSTALVDNTSLLTLNLSYNKIGDEGAQNIANGLKFNRTLLSLNLASNGIGDVGVKCIANVLTHYPLTHDEVIKRRQYLTKITNNKIDDNEVGIKTTSSLTTLQKKPSSNSIQAGKKTKTKSKGNKDSKRERSDNTRGGLRGKKGKGSQSNESFETPTPPPEEVLNPLYGKVDYVNGELWVQGNQVLINLNLSRNEMTSKGLNDLTSAIEKQDEYIMPGNIRKTGLLRVSLQKNEFCSSDYENYLKLCELVTKRNPLNNSEDLKIELKDEK